MNKMIRTLLTVAALALGSTSLLAQPAVKLVVVDMARVFDNHYKSEEANAKFRDAEQKAQEQAEEIRKQGQTIVDEYKELDEQAKNSLLTPEARSKAQADAQKKLEEIQRKQNELQSFMQNTQRSLQQRIKTHRDLLLEEISKTVADMAKKAGATLVVDKSGPTLFGIPAVVAKGTSLAVIVPTAVMGTWRNRTKHNTDLRVAAVVGMAGIVSAFVASQISVGLSETTSNVLFALLLAVVAVRMLWQLRTERRALQAADAADAAEATAG